MRRVTAALALAAIVIGSAVSDAPGAGSWQPLPRAPFAVRQSLTSAWTGRQLIVYGRNPLASPAADVGEAYDPATRKWARLAPPHGPGYVPGYDAVWTGRQLLVFGAFHSVAYDPARASWRELPKPVPGGIVVWTGREAIGWGGGCCGDAWSNGVAYDPATRTYRALRRSPLAPSQRPVGAWSGRELLLVVSRFDLEGKPWLARFARAAAYDPRTTAWRRIAAPPEEAIGTLGVAAWDGRELLLVAAGADGRSTFAYDAGTNRWRRRASAPTGRRGPTVVRAGDRIVVWGGQSLDGTRPLGDGLAYDTRADRWSRIPAAPLRPRSGSVVAWTGRDLIVWGGGAFADGAAYRLPG